jgi:hypothetical protein
MTDVFMLSGRGKRGAERKGEEREREREQRKVGVGRTLRMCCREGRRGRGLGCWIGASGRVGDEGKEEAAHTRPASESFLKAGSASPSSMPPSSSESV